jgi:glycosyltransferase involved in cell wall biosynthesis
MASGLPILSSNMGPMPEILEGNGIYFNPLSINEIENAIIKSIESPDLMFELSKQSFLKAKSYSWKNCSDETFKFINTIANKFSKDRM